MYVKRLRSCEIWSRNELNKTFCMHYYAQ